MNQFNSFGKHSENVHNSIEYLNDINYDSRTKKKKTCRTKVNFMSDYSDILNIYIFVLNYPRFIDGHTY